MIQSIIVASVALVIGATAPVPPEGTALPVQRGSYHFRVERGTLSQFARGPTDSQIWYHTEVTGLLDKSKGYVSYIAVVDCDKVGKDAWVKIGSGAWRYAFVFDCSGHVSTTTWMNTNGIPAELDWYTAEELGLDHSKGIAGAVTYQNPYKHGGNHEISEGVMGGDKVRSIVPWDDPGLCPWHVPARGGYADLCLSPA